jgi:hypothetical protein
MKPTIRLFFCVIVFVLTSCNQTNEKNKSKNIVHEKVEEPKFVPNEKFLTKHSDSCGCSAQFELKDSLKLIHVKDQFYKSATGHLYERTVGLQEINGHLTDHEYFNGHFSQEVDPLTFEPLDGWYAKDKNYVYYYRPVSGGMQISKMDEADTKTFKLLAGHYKYAMDKKFYYDEPQIIKGFLPSKTKQKIDIKGRVIEMTCNNKTYKFEIVE